MLGLKLRRMKQTGSHPLPPVTWRYVKRIDPDHFICQPVKRRTGEDQPTKEFACIAERKHRFGIGASFEKIVTPPLGCKPGPELRAVR